MSDYILPHSMPREEKRLALMSHMLDPHTMFRLSELGVGQGWRCLEIGAGNGSLSQWLADRVGPAGHVVASDIDTRYLDALEVPNLEVRALDVTKDGLGEDYDLVLVRDVLHHLPARDDVLLKLATTVKPGGVLFVQEPDFHPVLNTDNPAVRDFWQGFLAWSATRGIDYFVGRKLAPALSAAGMTTIDVHGETILFQGGSAYARFWLLTFEELRDPILSSGLITKALWNETMALFEDPAFWTWQNSFVVTRAKKPG
ncbi:MAG: methyltransferase [Pseudomonadota bacterium]